MPKPLTWHCDDGFTWAFTGRVLPQDVIEHLGHPGLFEPSLAWSLHQAAEALRALVVPQIEWVAYHLSRLLTRHR